MSNAFVAIQLHIRSFYLPPHIVPAAGLLDYGLHVQEEESVQYIIAFSLVDKTNTFDQFRFSVRFDLDTCARVL